MTDHDPASRAEPRRGGLISLIMRLSGGGEHGRPPPGDHAEARPAAPASDPITADKFRGLVEASKQAQLDREQRAAKEAELEQHRQVKAMLQEHLDAEMWEKLIEHARTAAAHGEKEFQLLRFPCDVCSDGGRKIDVVEDGWPETLRGEAADLYGRWERELKPAGFGLSARILDYPHGEPGDVGLFLTWGG